MAGSGDFELKEFSLIFIAKQNNNMKDPNASKDNVSTIVNAWWFKFCLFGGATALLAFVAQNYFLTGIALGMGVMSFFVDFVKK